ncbi:radical SAM protein [Tolypothrix sp. FACHB-123]|uniref:radical SAM protein n=1 Tax=Tolypothrix sp. FACHB-123 TaxID=2692868 RepID=UPI001684C884|nr:radical SAM protein [Tolypothrix sp. FACHB-123]MBD2356463.1 radical SAM protein [Tolypothrix sp. FACHB-123]
MSATLSRQQPQHSAVYGPVNSWRFGRSLGIDPICSVSTCSFNCVYCQLGKIQVTTTQRQIFVPTMQIFDDLRAKLPLEQIDVVTLSGSGEPTLALNLEKIIGVVKKVTRLPTVVLTNSTMLHDPTVRSALKLADIVAAKLDAISSNQLQQINRPVETINLPDILAGIEQFRQEYQGHLAIQTMVLSRWTPDMVKDYIEIIQRLQPNEIQINVPSRPRVLVRQLEARGNNIAQSTPYLVQNLKCVSGDILAAVATQIHDAINIPVTYPAVA